ncbi:hypothetical protein D3C80_1063390 [compost metagenome]
MDILVPALATTKNEGVVKRVYKAADVIDRGRIFQGLVDCIFACVDFVNDEL